MTLMTTLAGMMLLQDGDAARVIAGFAVLGFLAAIYFFPSIVAISRNMEAAPGVVIVNLFFGWTVLFWIIALIWAFSGSQTQPYVATKKCPDCAELVKRDAAVCKHCGYTFKADKADDPSGPPSNAIIPKAPEAQKTSNMSDYFIIFCIIITLIIVAFIVIVILIAAIGYFGAPISKTENSSTPPPDSYGSHNVASNREATNVAPDVSAEPPTVANGLLPMGPGQIMPPNPTTLATPSIMAAPPAVNTLNDQAISAVARIVAEWSAPNAEALGHLQSLYPATVQFYGKPISGSAVIAQKQSFMKQWDLRDYRVDRSSEHVQCDTSTSICTVSGTMIWDAKNSEKRVHSFGTSEFEYELSLANGSISIILENSHILTRQAQHY